MLHAPHRRAARVAVKPPSRRHMGHAIPARDLRLCEGLRYTVLGRSGVVQQWGSFGRSLGEPHCAWLMPGREHEDALCGWVPGGDTREGIHVVRLENDDMGITVQVVRANLAIGVGHSYIYGLVEFSLLRRARTRPTSANPCRGTITALVNEVRFERAIRPDQGARLRAQEVPGRRSHVR